jgi:hypothetical protein
LHRNYRLRQNLPASILLDPCIACILALQKTENATVRPLHGRIPLHSSASLHCRQPARFAPLHGRIPCTAQHPCTPCTAEHLCTAEYPCTAAHPKATSTFVNLKAVMCGVLACMFDPFNRNPQLAIAISRQQHFKPQTNNYVHQAFAPLRFLDVLGHLPSDLQVAANE